MKMFFVSGDILLKFPFMIGGSDKTSAFASSITGYTGESLMM